MAALAHGTDTVLPVDISNEILEVAQRQETGLR